MYYRSVIHQALQTKNCEVRKEIYLQKSTLTNGWSISWIAVCRAYGSCRKQHSRKSCPSSLRVSGIAGVAPSPTLNIITKLLSQSGQGGWKEMIQGYQWLKYLPSYRMTWNLWRWLFSCSLKSSNKKDPTPTPPPKKNTNKSNLVWQLNQDCKQQTT